MKPTYPSYASAPDHVDDEKESFFNERSASRSKREQRMINKRNHFRDDDYAAEDHMPQARYRAPKAQKRGFLRNRDQEA